MKNSACKVKKNSLNIHFREVKVMNSATNKKGRKILKADNFIYKSHNFLSNRMPLVPLRNQPLTSHCPCSCNRTLQTNKTHNAVQRNNEARSRNIVAVEKQNVLHIRLCARACGRSGEWARSWACVYLTLLIQHATHMRHNVTSYVAPHARPQLSTLLH